ncbi:transposase [candidate division MSBL1 archaeon SCGC-AAA259O05]|uniref:Transposase n=1 Tax=candidate division MSBL1 archaeon SCGC-AAA259O05 TaxID=1698271 RepID=A0A133V5K7_9EURY|nr:transposase [candidate division MSBL1 archaeon SCGC-AAA259O05]
MSEERKIKIQNEKITLTDEVETFFEKKVKSLGNSGRVSVPKRFIGKRAYVIVLKD